MFWTGFLLSLSLCLDLGIVNVAAMRAGVRDGGMASLALGIGSCFGDLVYATVAVAGVSTLLGLPAVRWTTWLAGTAALVYLSVKAVRDDWRHAGLVEPSRGVAEARRPLTYLAQGFGLALASPSAILWFASVGGAVIASSTGSSFRATALFFAGFFAAGLLWSIVVALISAQGRRLGDRSVRVFGVVSAAVFIWLAVGVFLNGYREFVLR
jgi:L-lysine exporter family protein LysE/ArgO